MQHGKTKATVSVHLIHILMRFTAQNGIDLMDSFKEAEIDPLILRDNKARVSVHQFYRIWKTACRKKDDTNIGLHFGREIGDTYFKMGLLFSMMAGAGTIKKALELFCRYHDLSEDAILPKISIEGDRARLSWETASPDFHFTRQLSEALLCAYVRILQNIADADVNLLEVRFLHEQPPDIREHLDIFKAPLRFDQQKTEIVINAKDLDLPVFFADPDLIQTLEDLAQKQLDQLYDSTIWTARVRELIGKRLARGNETGINIISSMLAVSPRKLQSRLRDENTTFQKILDQIRRQIASKYLSNKKLSISEIALQLGFSEQSAFNHAFRRWTGLTPGQFRKNQNLSGQK